MKTNIIRRLALVALVWTPAGAQQKEISQGIVSTGRVLELSKEKGDLTLRSSHAARNLVFRGMQSTPVYDSTGRRATFADIEPGQPATIYYTPSRGGWLVAKIVIPESEQSRRARQPLVAPTPVGPSGRRGHFHVPRVPNTVR